MNLFKGRSIMFSRKLVKYSILIVLVLITGSIFGVYSSAFKLNSGIYFLVVFLYFTPTKRAEFTILENFLIAIWTIGSLIDFISFICFYPNSIEIFLVF